VIPKKKVKGNEASVWGEMEVLKGLDHPNIVKFYEWSILSGVKYLHEHDIVHRDLKPENILYRTRDAGSDIVIADFGIAKHLHPSEEQLMSLAGSFGYVAPEVLNQKGHGKAVDLWSTGIITYAILCGYSPFRSDDVKELVRETTAAKIEFHERYWKNVSDDEERPSNLKTACLIILTPLLVITELVHRLIGLRLLRVTQVRDSCLQLAPVL
ncbi:Pkinase-domain-containing protein, partial [Dentipellis sp. KUC8613]